MVAGYKDLLKGEELQGEQARKLRRNNLCWTERPGRAEQSTKPDPWTFVGCQIRHKLEVFGVDIEKYNSNTTFANLICAHIWYCCWIGLAIVCCCTHTCVVSRLNSFSGGT